MGAELDLDDVVYGSKSDLAIVELAALRAEVERLKAERTWQPIKSAPIGEKVVMFNGSDYAKCDAVNKVYKQTMRLWTPLPLPEPPEEEK